MKGDLRLELVIAAIVVVILLSIFLYVAWRSEQTKKRQLDSLKNFSTKPNTTTTLPMCNTTGGACDGYAEAVCMYNKPDDFCELSSSIQIGEIKNWTCLEWHQYYGEVNETDDCRSYEKCFCGNYTKKKSILIDSIEWFIGDEGESCEEVCSLYDKTCNEIEFSSIQDKLVNCELQETILNKIFSSYCISCNLGNDDGVEIYIIGDQECYSMFMNGDKLNCTTRDPSAKRLCPCE